MSDFLVTYLDSIDERLLDYLDEDEGLKLDAVKRLRFYTAALLEGSISPDHVMEDWPDWYQLVPAFVATYGSEELQELEVAAELLEAIEEDDNVTEADRDYLKASYARAGADAWLVFGTTPGGYNEEPLVEFLEELHRHLGGDMSVPWHSSSPVSGLGTIVFLVRRWSLAEARRTNAGR